MLLLQESKFDAGWLRLKWDQGRVRMGRTGEFQGGREDE